MTPLQIFRMVATEFQGETDDFVSDFLSLVSPLVSSSQFGSSYPMALALMAAHKMKMSGRGNTEIMDISQMTNVQSYREGDVQINYNTYQQGNKDADGEYSLTSYGIQFLSLRRKKVVPILISGMRPNG